MFFDISKLSALLVCACVLVSCGGGGGGAQPTQSSSVVTSATTSIATSVSSSLVSSQLNASSSLTATSNQSTSSSSIIATSNQSSSVTSSLSSSSIAKVYPNKIAATIWVGESDALVQFVPEAEGLEFARSRTDCNFSQMNTCLLGQSNVVTQTSIRDTAFTTGNTAYYALRNGDSEAKRFINPDSYGYRAGAESISFNGKLWVIGGHGNNDVWSSSDGHVWRQEVEHTEFPIVEDHRVVLFKNELWLIGGGISSIWSSSDGITWTKRKDNAMFAARTRHQVVVFNNKLWVIGGYADDLLNDVWSSDDGVNWTKQVEAASFSARDAHQVIVFNNKLWLIGGYDGSYKDDVWTSDDGVTWTKEALTSSFGARDLHGVSVVNGMLWLVGGFNGEFLNDIWTSVDGLNWQKLAVRSFFPKVAEAKITTFNGGVAVFGGRTGSGWLSDMTGNDWISKSLPPDLYSNPVVSFKNKLLVLNGSDRVSTSLDGLQWNNSSLTVSLPWRGNYSLVEHNNRLWLIGGFVQFGQYKNDVWSSADGIEWQLETSAAGFEPRSNSVVASFDNKLWLIGGYGFNKYFNDIWSSADGVTWANMGSSSLPSSGVLSTQLKVFNNKLWLVIVSGSIFAQERNIQLLSSVNGVEWVQEPVNNGLTIGDYFKMEVVSGRLWIVSSKGVWSSTDGAVWMKESDTKPFNASQSFVWKDNLMMLESKDSLSIKLWASPDGKNWRRGYKDEFIFGASN